MSLDWYKRKVEEILERRKIRQTRAVSLANLVPLLDAALEQLDVYLRELWAQLLANAMDPSKPNILRVQFIDTLKKISPSRRADLESPLECAAEL